MASVRSVKFALLVGIALLVFGWNFWGSSIYWLDEVKNAWCAVEIQHRDNVLVPYFNGEYHDKPGLPYFFMQFAYALFGINAFAARFFSMICGVGVVSVIYLLTKRYVNEAAATIASFILIASLQMGMQFKMATPDPYLLFFLTAAFASFYHSVQTQSRVFLRLFYLAIGLAFFAKGPVAVALPGLALVLFLWQIGNFRWATIKWILDPVGILVFAFAGGAWYVMVGIETHGDWLTYFFVTHNLDRYSNTFEGHRGFPLDTWVILLAGLLPLSVFLPQAVVEAWRERKSQSLHIYCLAIIVAFCGFFMFSKTVLPSYPAPAMPFAAILIAQYLVKLQALESVKWSTRISLVILVLISLALAIGGYLALSSELPLVSLAGKMIPTLIILPIGAIIGGVFVVLARVKWGIWTLIGTFIAFQLLVFGVYFPEADRANPVVQSVPLIKTMNVPIAYFQRMNPAFVFQLGHNIEKLETQSDVDRFVQRHGDVVIISTKREWEAAQIAGFQAIFEGKDLFEPPVTIVVTNKK